MLLDVGTVLAGIGLAVLGFVVVVLVCVVILRLLAAILPSYEDRAAQQAASPEPAGGDEDAPVTDAGTASMPGVEPAEPEGKDPAVE